MPLRERAIDTRTGEGSPVVQNCERKHAFTDLRGVTPMTAEQDTTASNADGPQLRFALRPIGWCSVRPASRIGAPVSNAVGPTLTPERTVLLPDRQAGSGAPVAFRGLGEINHSVPSAAPPLTLRK